VNSEACKYISAEPAANQRLAFHQGAVFWLTGLSGAGKSTLSNHVCRRLRALGYRSYTLDGDTLRAGLNADLGFSATDRKESVRRAAHAAALLADAGNVVLVALISPFAADRGDARTIVGTHFHEVFVSATIETCKQRDPKGLYLRALRGDLHEFTGISSPYETPAHPDLLLDTGNLSVSRCGDRLLGYITNRMSENLGA